MAVVLTFELSDQFSTFEFHVFVFLSAPSSSISQIFEPSKYKNKKFEFVCWSNKTWVGRSWVRSPLPAKFFIFGISVKYYLRNLRSIKMQISFVSSNVNKDFCVTSAGNVLPGSQSIKRSRLELLDLLM